MGYKIKELEVKMKEILPSKRYRHALGVEYTAACLAMRYGADLVQAQTAGILHDCAKPIEDSEMLRQCKKYQIPVSAMEQKLPYLLHGKLGAYYAKQCYGIDNAEILSAITYHTTGKSEMSLLEKIIFLADYMEPGRKEVPGLANVRSLAFCRLDEAVYQTLKNTLSYLSSGSSNSSNMNSESCIDPATKQAYEYYKKIYEKL